MMTRRQSSSSSADLPRPTIRRRSRRRSSSFRNTKTLTDVADKVTRRSSIRTNRWVEAHKTLKEILKKKGNIIVFREFLKTEYSHENLDFWLEVEQYKKVKNATERRERAQEIFDTYIRYGAPDQVNLTHEAHQSVIDRMTSPCSETFCVAQQEIYKLIENDSFRRFIQNMQSG